MREIKFKGKRKDTDEWVYGSLVILKEDGITKYFILEDNYDMTEINEFITDGSEPLISLKELFVEVTPETVVYLF